MAPRIFLQLEKNVKQVLVFDAGMQWFLLALQLDECQIAGWPWLGSLTALLSHRAIFPPPLKF
ncbi:unnamed protein product [Miscanthus lutarioriparius]|uniref:Uncharacterized protein n=1 Tax=Miscanthus lutarioriparius TaxID=422564 RepID=A0A811MLG0_9POAL|nr:unnamed protein product [Miscanthus lutarioriparius]